MSIEWRKSLEIGVEEIDSQHKELFMRCNDLLTACSAGKGREEVCRLLSFLSTYVNTHFAAEERLQAKYDYPGYEEHHRQHRKFVDDLARLKELLSSEGVGPSLVAETNRATVSWLISHISGMDKALGLFLRGKL